MARVRKFAGQIVLLAVICPAMLAPTVLLVPPDLFASAFLFYAHDAKAAGMATAVVSSIDNPSAVLYNPAMLPYQKGFGFSQTQSLLVSHMKVTPDATGTTWETSHEVKRIPSFFLKYSSDRLSLGIGMFSLFGMNTEWPNGWDGRYNGYLSDLDARHINPVIAYRLTDNVSLGFGVSYVTSSFVRKNAISLGILGDGQIRVEGDGEAFGFNAGITMKLPDEYTLSLTYRSPITIDYKGRATFAVPNAVKSNFPDGPAMTRITLPYIAVVGLSKKYGPLTVEGDFRLTGWSSTRGYDLQFETGRPVVSQYTAKNWSNAFAVAIGVNYQWNDYLELRAGYMYDETPIPPSTLSFVPPDSSRNILAAGFGLKFKRFSFDAGYEAIFLTTRSTQTTTAQGPDNRPFNGTLKGMAHLISFTIGCRF